MKKITAINIKDTLRRADTLSLISDELIKLEGTMQQSLGNEYLINNNLNNLAAMFLAISKSFTFKDVPATEFKSDLEILRKW